MHVMACPPTPDDVQQGSLAGGLLKNNYHKRWLPCVSQSCPEVLWALGQNVKIIARPWWPALAVGNSWLHPARPVLDKTHQIHSQIWSGLPQNIIQSSVFSDHPGGRPLDGWISHSVWQLPKSWHCQNRGRPLAVEGNLQWSRIFCTLEKLLGHIWGTFKLFGMRLKWRQTTLWLPIWTVSKLSRPCSNDPDSFKSVQTMGLGFFINSRP